MNKFKALVVDFDGTLVDKNFYLSSRVKDAIIQFVKNGFILSIATGRPFNGVVKKVCSDLVLEYPQIVSGGSVIIEPKTEKIIWHEYFPEESAEKLVNKLLENNYDFTVESDGLIYTINKADKSIGYGPNILFSDLNEVSYEKIGKIVLFAVASMGDPEALEKGFNSEFPDLHFVRSGNGSGLVLDITSAKATKHMAVLELTKILGIEPSLMVGVGDGFNDYPLLSACGYKVAMENAPDELKEIADIIVPSVENDGLLVVVNKLLNGKL